MPQFTEIAVASGRSSPKPAPSKIWHLNEPPFDGFKPVDAHGYANSSSSTAIVVDFGKLTPAMHGCKMAVIFLYQLT